MKNIHKHLFKVFVIIMITFEVASDTGDPIVLFKRNLEPIKHSNDKRTIYESNQKFRVNNKEEYRSKDLDNEDDIKALLEEKYKFKNDEISTRFKVAGAARGFPGW